MPLTRMDFRIESVEASLTALQDTVKTHTHNIDVLTEKLDMVIKGQALIASELATNRFGPDRPMAAGEHSSAGSPHHGGTSSR